MAFIIHLTKIAMGIMIATSLMLSLYMWSYNVEVNKDREKNIFRNRLYSAAMLFTAVGFYAIFYILDNYV